MKKIARIITLILTAAVMISAFVPITGFANGVNVDTMKIVFTYEDMKSLSIDAPELPRVLADSDIEDYNYRSCLSENNKAVYDAFLKLDEPTLEPFTVELPDTIAFKTKTLNLSENEEFYTICLSNCASGLEAATFDNPWIFWLDCNNLGIEFSLKSMPNIFSGGYIVYVNSFTFTPRPYSGFESFEQVLEYKEKLEQTVDSYVIEGETRYEQLKSIHDSISCFTYYDTEGRFSGSVLSALMVPGAVCEGYSKGFKILADRVGIPTICVFGNYNAEERSAHMWNYVLMEDGKWYAVDVTWDDRDREYGYEIVYSYFLKGSDEFNIKHTPTNDYNSIHLEYPELSNTNYCEQPENVKVTTKPIITTTTKPVTTTTAKPVTTTTAKPVTTTTAKPVTTTTAKPVTTTTTKPVTTEIVAPQYENGDLNKDGVISAADLVCCAKAVMGTAEYDFSCDVDGDGRLSVFDVIKMRCLIVEKTLGNTA